ncbi:MAG: response regulator [Acidobacteria bacterium]|nr:response regulator [Acidobacteriota bacterium]
MSVESGPARKILVVDDEPDVCTYLSRLFQENGYQSACAADGQQAMEAVERERPDLITLDLSMPNKSGVRFYREIKARADLKTIPVVFVTGVTGPGGSSADTERFYRTRSQVPPPDGFIAKPIDPEEVLGLVAKLLGGSAERR